MTRHAASNAGPDEAVTLETGIEALQSSPEFRGPVEPLEEHNHANDHFALVYESREEQFAAAIPFLRQGLQRDERCLYVTYENSREEVLAAMRDYDIDVDAALESGQLSIHDEQETYLRNETFDADETVEFIDAAIEEATEEYEALRMTGEMSSVLEEDPECEELVRCEAKANYLFDDVDGLALCQYNRERFPAEVIRDVISTHPLLVHDGRVGHNVYYTPPGEFFGDEKADREVDRLLGSFREQTDAKAALCERERYLRESYEITADPGRSFEEKLQALFDLGCEQFDLAFGFLNRVDPAADRLEIEHASGDHDHYDVGAELPLSETYCQAAVDIREPASITDPVEDGYDDILVNEDFRVDGYLGTYVPVDGGPDRTLAFVPGESQSVSVSDEDRTYLELMGQWIGNELSRRRRERELHERTEHLNALVETTPECIKTVAEDGTLLQMNPAGLSMVEAPSESAVTGENVYDLIAPEHRERFREFNERICRGERGTLEFDIVGLEGTRRHMESHAAPLERPDGTTVHVALTRDVTERRERERALRESEEQLRALIDVLPVGVFVAEADGQIVEWNDAAEAIWGGDVAEADSIAEYDRYDGWWADSGEPVDPDEWALARALRGEAVTDPDEIEIEGFDGERRTVLNYGVPVRDADGEVTRAVVTVVDITERKNHERYLRELSEVTADPALPTDEKFERLLDVGCERLDLSVGTFRRDHGSALEVERVREAHPVPSDGALAASVDHYRRQVADAREPITVPDAGAADRDGDPRSDEAGLEAFVGIPVTVGGDAYGTLCFADASPRDGSFTEAELGFLDLMAQCVGYEIERRRRETRLNLLNDIGRELLDAETADAVAEGVVAATEDTFERSVAAVALYDEERGGLQPTAHTEAAEPLLAETSLFERADGAGWKALIDGEPKRVAAPLDRDGEGPTARPPVSEVIIHPLGNDGVYLVGATAPDGFRHGDTGVIETGAATVRAALDRTDRERQLQERERVLEAQNETLERMNRVNDTIRNIVKALVDADTRDEIEQVVCEELAHTGPYELAWIGDYDVMAGEVTPVESAGTEKGYLDDVTITVDDSAEGRGPAGRALKTGEPQFVDNVLEDRSFEPWRQDALDRGYHATAAFPLTYDNAQYGVLNLYAVQPEVFDSLEREVLTELSDTIAHALNTIESKKGLVSDRVTELEFTVDDRNLGVVELARELECEFEHKRLVSQADGGVRAFFAVRGAAASDVLAFESRLPVTDLHVVSNPDDAPCVFEAAVTGESLPATVVDHGARLRQIHVEDGSASVVVHLAADADVREFVEMFRATYPDSELTAQRTDELSQRTALEFVTALMEVLTARQEETLQMAYFNGYFEEPRARTASEIAESMDISQPTFNSHLRTALRKLCRHIYERDVASA